MNKGTKDGTIEEIEFVKELNKNKPSKYWDELNLSGDCKNIYAVHVIFKKFGKINNKKVLPKADVFLAKPSIGITDSYLINNNYYLNENDQIRLGLIPIKYTGISIKRIDSQKYQILKMSPNTFKTIFGSYELGAGASIYCSSEREIENNNIVFSGWNTNLTKFKEYFKLISNPTLQDYKRIKKISNDYIKNQILTNKDISDFVFRGIGNFDEPYTANWILEKGILRQLTILPFVVTTGSGRHHGDFTIVIKPK